MKNKNQKDIYRGTSKSHSALESNRLNKQQNQQTFDYDKESSSDPSLGTNKNQMQSQESNEKVIRRK